MARPPGSKPLILSQDPPSPFLNTGRHSTVAVGTTCRPFQVYSPGSHFTQKSSQMSLLGRANMVDILVSEEEAEVLGK